MEKLRVLDLFSGIGGFSLGLERTGGFETVAFCEIEPFCQRVLRKHWPDVPCYDDVRTLTADRLAADGIAVDVICGGFPCEGISIAGSGKGLADPRSGLWSEFARLIGEIQPQSAIIENSPKLRSRGLHTILADLDALGFNAEWHCVPAAYVGAPHRRDRIWIIAYRQGDAFSPDANCIGPYPTNVHFGREIELLHKQVGDAGQVAWGHTPPPVQRVVDGVPARLDINRLRGCGRAVVPQIPELIGRAILHARQAA